jgi:hypothetical protein
MEPWRNTWRVGLAPLLSLEQLRVLRQGLLNNDPRIIQGATTEPPPIQALQDWEVEKCDALCFGFAFEGVGADAKSDKTVAEVEEWFARSCFQIDQALGEPAGCRHFLNWWDEKPRELVFEELLLEVTVLIDQRLEEGIDG